MKKVLHTRFFRVYWHRSCYRWCRWGEGRNLPFFRMNRRWSISVGLVIHAGRLAIITGREEA